MLRCPENSPVTRLLELHLAIDPGGNRRFMQGTEQDCLQLFISLLNNLRQLCGSALCDNEMLKLLLFTCL